MDYGRNVVFHFRVEDGSSRLVHNGGVTVVFVPVDADGPGPGINYTAGAAACSLKETYNKKLGRKIAESRARSGVCSVAPEFLKGSIEFAEAKAVERDVFYAELRELASAYAYHVGRNTSMFKNAPADYKIS